MNKKVLTTAQVRAMFKNYTMSLAVAGSVLTSASCEKGDGKKDGKSGETPSAEDAKKFVTKDDLTNATKDLAKSSSVTAVSYDDATKTLTVAGKPVKIEAGSGLSVADLTKKGYKLDNDKIVETSNDKEQRTIVDILKDLMGGSTGVSLDSTEFKIDAGKLVKKDATADAAIINKTVAELIVDMITDKLKDTVNKNDAKIVVKAPLQNPGSAYAASSNEYTHQATFDAANTVDNTKEERTLDLGKEIVGAKTEVEANKRAAEERLEAIENNTAEALRILGFSSVFASTTVGLNLPKVKEELAKQKFLGIVKAAGGVGDARVNTAGIDAGLFGDAVLGSDCVGKVFAYRDTTAAANVYNFYKIAVNANGSGLTAQLLNPAGTWASVAAIGGV